MIIVMKDKCSQQTKTIFYIFLIIIIVIGLVSIYLKSISKFNDNLACGLPMEYINLDKKIPNCNQRNLNNKILLITSRYCPHCKEVTKILMPLIIRYNLEANFKTLDVINKDDLRTLNNLSITISSVPVLIINCAAYLGLKRQDQYAKLFATFYKKIKVDSQ